MTHYNSLKALKNFFFILLLIIVTTVIWIGNDIYIQFFSEITKYFKIENDDVHYLIRFNLVGCVCMSILAGPIADVYGKKLIFISGLLVYIVSSLICFFSGNFNILLLGRFLQGIAEATINVLSWVILFDYFSVSKSGKIAGLINGVSTLLLLLLPLAALLISNIYNWHLTLIIMPILAIIALIIAVFVIEEKREPVTTKKLHLKELFCNYLRLIKNYKFMTYTFIYSIPVAADAVFFSNASVVFVDLHMTLEEFTYSGTINSMFYIAASFLSIYLIAKKGIDSTKNAGFIIFTLGASGLFITTIIHNHIIYIIFSCIFVMSIGSALMEGFLLRSVNIFKDIKGTAMSFNSIIGYVFIARKVFWSQLFFDNTILPAAAVILVFCTISVALLAILRYKKA